MGDLVACVKAERDGVGSVRGKRTPTVFDFVFSVAHSLQPFVEGEARGKD